MTDHEQRTWYHPSLDAAQIELGDITAPEPVVDGVKCVVVTSSAASRSSFHQQQPLADEIAPRCGRTLSAERTEWTLKPKGAMERSTADRCPDCFAEGVGLDE